MMLSSIPPKISMAIFDVCALLENPGLSNVFPFFMKTGQIWGIFMTEDLKIQFLRFEDTIILSHFTTDIWVWCSGLKIWRQHILNTKIQNILLCVGSPKSGPHQLNMILQIASKDRSRWLHYGVKPPQGTHRLYRKLFLKDMSSILSAWLMKLLSNY